MCVGIDLSLRSTGLVYMGKNGEVKYKLVMSDSKNLNDEELLIYNAHEIYKFIKKCNPSKIALEGLSFNSVSSSKDIIAGNFWYLRAELCKLCPDIEVEIVPVLTWRSKLFNKEERTLLKENNTKVKELKKVLMTLPKEEKTKAVLENEQLILNSDIKYVTWAKLPEPYKSEFHKIGIRKGCYDLSDAYHICNHIFKNHK
jgi:hypothetical protein